ncbi:iron-sulfur cluster repair di-iron protein, ric [Gulosibacter molinativorax]|uniref:Iron-sulfur cluster repair di-iron protein, ric n=2 Tax=Gulosibacter molinativorax TaxID=256821 RepID=A0ABT7C6V4_9MICO|nr:iron-sulfur cluster repair di-iron protein, ric [Gulosibacter molinativorax]QUY62246.1 Hypotetical protein [Gulosibacter molinativorax]
MPSHSLKKAAQLAPIIERVHGEHHPELTRVREITQELQKTDNSARTSALFAELRAVTNNYAIPRGVCGGFEAAYQALEQSDREMAA